MNIPHAHIDRSTDSDEQVQKMLDGFLELSRDMLALDVELVPAADRNPWNRT